MNSHCELFIDLIKICMAHSDIRWGRDFVVCHLSIAVNLRVLHVIFIVVIEISSCKSIVTGSAKTLHVCVFYTGSH